MGGLWAKVRGTSAVWTITVVASGLWLTSRPAIAEDEEEVSDTEEDVDGSPEGLGARVARLAEVGRGLDREDRLYRGRRSLMQISQTGAIGGIRVVDAASGSPKSARVILGGNLLGTHGWLEDGQSHSEIGMMMGVNWSPTPWLEVYGATRAWRNSNFAIDSAFVSNTTRTWLGAKAFGAPLPWLYAGGDFRYQVPMNGARGVGKVFGAAAYGFRGNLTVDMRENEDVPLPVIGRWNIGYLFENFGRSIDPLEQALYDRLPDELDPPRRPIGEEDRHFVTRAQRYGLQLDRTDVLSFGLGVEVPIEFRRLNTTVSPIMEWVMDAPVNRQGFACPPEASPGVDGCRQGQGVRAVRQALVFGARVHPPTAGLSAYASVDIGLSGVSGLVQEFAPQAPYRISFGFTYMTDFYKAPEAEVSAR